ncbi:MAG TPA: phage holin [Tetragenococcus sp.]|nr:phage holin [Tetragenococcus sp.]
MKLSNKQYDVLKWLLLIVSPALITLISGFGILMNYDATNITTAIGLITVFVGAITGVSSVKYNKED